MNNRADSPQHPIRVAAHRAGLTPATLRAWERRYGAVDPGRSEGGQRLYSDRDVQRLRTLRELTEAGRPISMVAGLSDQGAAELLGQDRAVQPIAVHRVGGETPAALLVNEAFDHMRALDPDGLERTLWRAAMTLGAQDFLGDVVGAFLTRVGEGWVSGAVTPGQEHLGTGVVERVLARLADAAGTAEGPTLVVATLPGERHGLGARLVSAAAVLEGWHVAYLGTDLPAADIAAAAEGVAADAVAISIVQDRPDETLAALSILRELLPADIAIVAGGAAAMSLPAALLPPGVQILDDLHGLGALRPV